MPEKVTKTAEVKSSAPLQNSEYDLKPFVCPACNLCARFLPLYRFNSSGTMAQIVLGHKPAIQCADCHAAYSWAPPSSPRARDGGWERLSLLVDREAVE